MYSMSRCNGIFYKLKHFYLDILSKTLYNSFLLIVFTTVNILLSTLEDTNVTVFVSCKENCL